MSALGGGDTHVDGGGEVTRLVSLNLLHFDIAFFSHAGGVYEVNTLLQNGIQQAF